MIKDKTISLYKFPEPQVPVSLSVTPKSSISDIANTFKDKTNNLCVRSQAAEDLIQLGDSAKDFIPDIISFIQEPDSGPYHGGQVYNGIACDSSRGNVAIDLPKFGAALNPFIPDLRKILNNKAQSSRVRGMSASALASLGDPAKVTVPDMVIIIRDKAQGFDVRSRVSRALMSFGNTMFLDDTTNPFIQDILNVLKDRPKTSGNTEADRLEMALDFRMGVSQLNFQQTLPFLDMAEFSERTPWTQWRFNAYIKSGGNDEIKHLLKWVGKPKLATIPTQLNYKDSVKTLTLFAKAWEFSSNAPHLRRGLMPKIAIVTRMGQWKPNDKPLLTLHYNNLMTVDPASAKVLKGAIDRLDYK